MSSPKPPDQFAAFAVNNQEFFIFTLKNKNLSYAKY